MSRKSVIQVCTARRSFILAPPLFPSLPMMARRKVTCQADYTKATSTIAAIKEICFVYINEKVYLGAEVLTCIRIFYAGLRFPYYTVIV